VFTLGVLLFAAGLVLSVAIHEFGHFYPARKFGVRVSQFMVGFGPTLFSRQRGETEYGFKAIPLGGYVRIIGMLPPRADLRRGPFKNLINQARATSMADLQPSDVGRAFYQLHPAKKLVVMLGGPVMNLVTAVGLLFIAFVLIGTPQPTTKVSTIINCLPTEISNSDDCNPGAPLSPAAKAKLQAGDQIVAINNRQLASWDELVAAIDGSAGRQIRLTILRGEIASTISVDVADISTSGVRDGYLGFTPKVELEKQSPIEIANFIGRVGSATATLLTELPTRMSNLVATAIGAQPRDLEGPISVVGVSVISGDLATQDAPAVWRLLDFIVLLASVNLALFFFNLLPILPLDGGHVASAIYEWGRRKTKGKRADQPVDTAKLMPLAYLFAMVLLGFSLLLIYVDLIAPIRLN
jgi:membrane-associated protease RseP (regulator of RpoE activity)